MDRFLDEQESPAALDRVGLSVPVATAADCDQVAIQQQTDDIKSCSHIHASGENIQFSEGDSRAKPYVSNADKLAVAPADLVVVSSLSSDLPTNGVAVGSTDDASAGKSAITDFQRTTTVLEVTSHSVSSCTNVASDMLETSKSTPILHSSCDNEMLSCSHVDNAATEMDTCVASADTLQTEMLSSDAVVSEAIESEACVTVVTVCDQQCSVDHLHRPFCETNDHCNQPVSLDAKQSNITESSITEQQESEAGHGCSVAASEDEVKAGDVELLLAAVDSATSVAGSLYSNADPLKAALEFASASVSVGLSSTADTVCQQATSFTDSSDSPSSARGTDCQPSLSPHLSSSTAELPISCADVSVFTSSLLPHSCSNELSAHVVKLACKSSSPVPHVMHASLKNMAVDEPPVTVTVTSSSALWPASEDVCDQAAMIRVNTEEVCDRSDEILCAEENELALSNSNQSPASCLQSASTSALCANTKQQADGTDSVDIISMKTSLDSVSCALSSETQTR